MRSSLPLRGTITLTFYRSTATSWSGRKYRSILRNWPPSSGRVSRKDKPDENGADLTQAYAAAPRERRPAGYSMGGALIHIWGPKDRPPLLRRARHIRPRTRGGDMGVSERTRIAQRVAVGLPPAAPRPLRSTLRGLNDEIATALRRRALLGVSVGSQYCRRGAAEFPTPSSAQQYPRRLSYANPNPANQTAVAGQRGF